MFIFTFIRCFLLCASNVLFTLCVFSFCCGDFIQCNIQLLVLAASGRSWKRLRCEPDHQVTFNPWDQTQLWFKQAPLRQVSYTSLTKAPHLSDARWLNGSYSSLLCTCPQKQTPCPSGSRPSSLVSCRAAGRSEGASVRPAASSSAGLSAACAPVQPANAHDPKEDENKNTCKYGHVDIVTINRFRDLL